MTAHQHFEEYVRKVYHVDVAALDAYTAIQLRMAFYSGISTAFAHGPQLLDDVVAYVHGLTPDRLVH